MPTSVSPAARVRWYAHPAVLWLAFIGAHVWTAWLNVSAANQPLGDVTGVYTIWMNQALSGEGVVGISSAWVYPIVALVPLFLATLPGMDVYPTTWLVMVSLLDALAFYFLIAGWRRPVRRRAAAWWWIALIVCLGPITLGRLDSVAAPLGVMGLMFLITRPRLASVILTAATWIKVWPAALLLSGVIALRSRWRVLVVAAVTSLVIIVASLLLGGGSHVLSFLTEQTTRGIQIESPLATPFIWLSVVQAPGYFVYYEPNLLTFQVAGEGVDAAASLSNVLLGLAVITALVLGFWRLRRGAVALHVLPSLALVLVAALIAFNKVGSPQYQTWLIAPIVLGLIIDRSRFAPVAIIVLVMAVLTQIFYPFYYDRILGLEPVMVVVMTIRNVLELVVVAMGVHLLATVRTHRSSARGRARGPESATDMGAARALD